MAEKMSVSGPVTVRSDSKERVAYDLMNLIAGYEHSPNMHDRNYWLTLYRQCQKAADGHSLKSVITQD
ncbi:hypothetical protein [Hydrogenophaga sp. ZJX-1]|uniref:hypothetical protein n=1 Tax=Hydrogenophaga sp. ZJX-1 TaxID=3404778 RepID=UPI003B28BB11